MKAKKTITAREKARSALTRQAIRLQEALQKAAAQLSEKASRYPPKTQRSFVWAFVLAGVTLSTLVTWQGLHRRCKLSLPAPVKQLVLPARPAYLNRLITEREYQRIHRFRQHLDSLKGSPFSDSLLALRPHLMDTLRFLENLYFLESKNK